MYCLPLLESSKRALESSKRALESSKRALLELGSTYYYLGAIFKIMKIWLSLCEYIHFLKKMGLYFARLACPSICASMATGNRAHIITAKLPRCAEIFKCDHFPPSISYSFQLSQGGGKGASIDQY